MSRYAVVLWILIILVAVFLLIWLAYTVTAAHQQTLSINLPLQNVYCHFKGVRYPINNVKITVTKRSNTQGIIAQEDLRNIIQQNVIDNYRNSIFIQESDLFILRDTKLARISMEREASLENVTRLLFSTLSPILGDTGCHLVSVKLISGDISVTSSRYKVSDYSV